MFGIFKTYSDVKRGIKDPASFGQDMALDMLKAPLILFTFLGGVFFTILFILGFTQFFGGPYSFFKVIFWFLGIPAGIFGFIVWSLFGKVKRVLDRTRRNLSQKGDIMDAEVVKVDKNLT